MTKRAQYVTGWLLVAVGLALFTQRAVEKAAYDYRVYLQIEASK